MKRLSPSPWMAWLVVWALLGVSPLANGAPAAPRVSPPEEAQRQADAAFMARLHDARRGPGSPRDGLRVDLTDERQYRFVMDRLRRAGKGEGALVRWLAAARERAKARQHPLGLERTSESDSAQWDCDHFVTLRDEELDETGEVPFHGRSILSCGGGTFSYSYMDLVAYDTDPDLKNGTVIGMQSGEGYGDVRHFQELLLSPTLPPDHTRRLLLESMAILMDDVTGEEHISFIKTHTTPGPSPIRVTLHHPRYAPGGPEDGDITSCHLLADEGCDYAVVEDDGEHLPPLSDPLSGAPTGVALRQAGPGPWLGDRDSYFPFSNEALLFDWTHAYVPTAFSLDLGMAPRGCRILQVTEAQVRLVKTATGGSCLATTCLEPDLQAFVGERTASVSRLLAFTPPGAESQCDLDTLQQNPVRFSIAIAANVDCGEGPTPRRYIGWSGDAPAWNLRLLNTPWMRQR